MTVAPATAAARVLDWLRSDEFHAEPVIETDDKPVVLDLSRGSMALGEPLENIDVSRFTLLVEELMQQSGTRFAFGRWGETRALYSNEHFAGEDGECRDVHLGVDLFCAAGTAVRAPLDGIVSVVANNARELDYGPMLVLRHTTPGGYGFYTLYGHLGMECTRTLRAGMPVGAGEVIASIGAPPVNGNWPPHLHFQLVLDLLNLGREFPGVARRSQRERWLGLSPNPAMFFPQVSAALLDGRDGA